MHRSRPKVTSQTPRVQGCEYLRRVLINPEDLLSMGKLGFTNSGSRMGRKAFLDNFKAKSMLMPKLCCIPIVMATFVKSVSRLGWAAVRGARPGSQLQGILLYHTMSIRADISCHDGKSSSGSFPSQWRKKLIHLG